MKTLIVDDSEDAAHILQIILSPFGQTEIANDGAAGLVAWEAAIEAHEPYDLVCLDIMMPGMDGLETLERLRQEEEELGLGGILGTKVVMVTAREDEKTINRALALGCEGYIFKTQGRKRILAKLTELGLIDWHE